MSYAPHMTVYSAARRPPLRRGRIAPPPPPPAGSRRYGLGELGAASAGVALAQTAVAEVPVVGPILSSFVGPILGAFDPGSKRDAGRKQRADGITRLANEGSLLAARQLYGAAEKGAVGAASEKALYAAAWSTFQSAHADIAAAARAAGPAGVGPDPVNGWNPPASDVAQYSKEVQQYQQYGAAALTAQAVKTRASALPGGTLGIVIGAGVLLAFLRRR